MPKYDYKCDDCGHRFETVQSMSEAPLTTCPECKGKIRKVISAAGVMFKGSGFYITDSKSKDSAAIPKPPSSDSGKTTK
jgi:putative FmdB family regulatory protein